MEGEEGTQQSAGQIISKFDQKIGVFLDHVGEVLSSVKACREWTIFAVKIIQLKQMTVNCQKSCLCIVRAKIDLL